MEKHNEAMTPGLGLYLLGAPEIYVEGLFQSALTSVKAQAVLFYLAATGRSHARATLASLLWGDVADAAARANLRKALQQMRGHLAPWLKISRDNVALVPDAGCWIDVAEFDAAFRDADGGVTDRLRRALDLYRGDFLQGFYVRSAPDFEAWWLAEQARLREQALNGFNRLADYHADRGELDQAITFTRRYLHLEPWREQAHRQMMRLLALNGQRGAALAQYKTCRQVLADELGVGPAPETVALHEQIRTGEPMQVPRSSAADVLSSVSLSPTKVPDFLQMPESSLSGDGLPFVAREHELARLDRWLDQTEEGQGRVAFVVGEPGSGKTVLLNEFILRMMNNKTDLVVAGGNCNAYGGIGDPYLPFREILDQLTGGAEARWNSGVISREQARRLWLLMPESVQALLDVGPDLLDLFVAGSRLKERAAMLSPRDTPWLAELQSLLAQREAGERQVNLEQADLFDAFTKVLQTLARQRSVVLVLDDLQWADAGSISLLFHLGRRLAGQRILVMGIYRPSDVALGRDGERHPLEGVVNEFQTIFGEPPLDLGQVEGRHFVDSILDVQKNRLGHAFRDRLYQHTQGQALFTVETLRDLQVRGDLVRDGDGVWVEGPAIDWTELPVRVEGVIGERIGRLPAALQEIIKVASVAGEEFIAEVVARVLGIDEREVIRQLSGALDKQHHLVQGRDGQRLEGQRLSQYRFRHILFQHYSYHAIDEVERAWLHEEVGNELEHLYQGQEDIVAVRLARHFREAGMVAKAVDYLQRAGELATRSFVYTDAIQFLDDAILLTETLAETPERRQTDLKLQLALAGAQRKAGQIAEALDTFRLSAEIAEGLKASEDQALAALGYEDLGWRFNLPAELATRLLESALNALGEEESALRSRVLISLSRALFASTGFLERRISMAQQAVAMARRINDPSTLYAALHNSVLANRQPEAIRERIVNINEMLLLAEQMGDTEKVLDIIMLRIYDQLALGNIGAVKADLETFTQIAQETQQPFYIYHIDVMQTGLLLLAGCFEQAENLAEKTLAGAKRMGVENGDGVYGMQMFTIRREQGRLQELAPVISYFVTNHSAAATWRPGLALIYSDLELEEETRKEFETLAAEDFADLPADALWLTSMAYLSEICAYLGDTGRAAILYQLLLPYAGHSVVVGFIVDCYGAVARYLGLLAATLSLWNEAEEHFEDALAANTRMGAHPWLAHTQSQYAAMLLARGWPHDRARAVSLLDLALFTARELGMKALGEKTEMLMRAVSQSDAESFPIGRLT